MKTFAVIFFSLFILAACKNEEAGNDKLVEGTGGTGRLADKKVADPIDSSKFTTVQWLDSSLNFGEVQQGEKVNLTFRFKNTGDKPLVVESAHAGCGCTVPEPSKEPVMPGQEGSIKATFDSKNQFGEIHKNVMVVMNTKPSRDHMVLFQGKVSKP